MFLMDAYKTSSMPQARRRLARNELDRRGRPRAITAIA
jgi:hypothetical protein